MISLKKLLPGIMLTMCLVGYAAAYVADKDEICRAVMKWATKNGNTIIEPIAPFRCFTKTKNCKGYYKVRASQHNFL